MATRAARKKTVSKPQRIAVIRTEEVPVKDLQAYHQNPRIGDINAVAKSLHVNGLFKPIVVNIGTHTGRKNEILAGNHTWLASRRQLEWEEGGETYVKESWDTILASFVDVDEQAAKKIVLADNKTSDASKYDEGILAEIFTQVDNIAGTGYDADEVDDLLAGIKTDVDGALESTSKGIDFDSIAAGFEDNETPDNRSEREKYASEREEGESGRVVKPDTPEDESDLEAVDSGKIDEVAELQVILELKEDNLYLGRNRWSIPELDPDKLLEEFPKNIQTWGGHEATPDDGKSFYLYNYSLGGMKGLPLDRSLLAFNTYDEKFINWWDTPAWLTARMMGKGLKMACVPDFSFYYTEGRVHHLWGVYRAQWLGRFFQDAGLKVVPRLQYDFRDPNTLEIALLGIPKNPPTLECSMQNVNEDQAGDTDKAVKIMREALEELQPKQFLLYGGNPGWEIFKRTGWKGEAIHCMNYAGVRRQAGVFGKKDGSASLTKKQKEELILKHGGDPKKLKKAVPDDDEL